jgi:hypothetical protein
VDLSLTTWWWKFCQKCDKIVDGNSVKEIEQKMKIHLDEVHQEHCGDCYSTGCQVDHCDCCDGGRK